MRNKKIVLSIILSAILVIVLIFSVIIPTFSKFKNGMDDPEWDGLVASGFKRGTGTKEDPYIISTPNELAYFATSMENENYEGKYIKLIKDIVINKGVFKNNTYIYDDETYYLGDDSKYYNDESLSEEVDSIKVLPIIKGFKGTFDGDFHTIYGLYEKDNDYNALFVDFSGNLKNLYIDNAYITGGYITAGLISNADNASIKNVMFNGRVSSNTTKQEETKTIKLDDITVTDTHSDVIEVPIISNIAKGILKGACSNTETFTLNDKEYECTEFEIETDNSLEITATEAKFTNMSYTLTYDLNKTAGIIGLAHNTDIDGAVNKGNINGLYTSGILGTGINTDIKNSYNNGKINGETSSGIIDTIMYSNSTISNVYNNGELLTGTKSGLISNTYNSTISVDKTFNTYDSNMINNNINSTLEIKDSYNTNPDKDFKKLNINTVKKLYPEYIDEDNIVNGNIWVQKELPILYFDDIKNRTVQVKIGNNTWDIYKEDYKEVKYDKEIEVLISTTDMYKPIKNVWYYAANEIVDKDDLDTVEWNEYKGIFSLKDDAYIVYVKYEDYDDHTYYINTDKLVIGSIKNNVSINSGNNTWTTSHTPKNKFLNKKAEYEIVNKGTSLSISKIEYIVAPSIMNKEALENATWNTYTGIIKPEEDAYIIYVKVTSIDSNITYLNTDKMITMSYKISNLKSGNNLEFSNYMTYNSSFNFKVELNHTVSLSNYNRYIKVDKMLPKNTKITIKDNNNTYYEYITTIQDQDTKLNSYIYPLSKFKKVGKATFDEYFDNSTYNSLDNESFNVFIDFNNVSKITDTYNLSFIAKNTEVINTLENNSVSFNLVDIETNSLTLSTNYNDSINYGRENTYNINLNTTLNKVPYNNTLVTNTTYEDLYEGISIEVVNKDNEIVSRNDLSDIRFKYNNNVYVFDRNNIININLGKSHNQNITLQVLTYNGNTNIDDTYNIKITGYLSLDGINKKYTSNSLEIPLVLKKTNNLDYKFDVSLTEPIINKGGKFKFKVNYEGKLEKPILKVSLYKKKELTAYNQEYELVDLNKYISNKLKGNNSKYDIKLEDIVFDIRNDVESNGYKFVFELFDNEDKITEVDIKTIIR